MTGPEAAQGLARGIHVAATMSIFGSALFQALVAPPAPVAGRGASVLQRRLDLLGWTALAAAAVAAVAWLGFQAVSFADGDSIGDILAAVPLILLDTHWGPLIAARFALLVPACLILGGVLPRGRLTLAAAAMLGLLALELQVFLGHGISMQGGARVLLVASELLHILAAGAWLGGLLPLLLLVAERAPEHSAAAVWRFSTVGVVCVAALVLTSLVQFWMLVGGLPGLIGTDYGRLALAKLCLFLSLLLLAALNRFRLRPRLAGADGAIARRHLLRSIVAESTLGLGILALAGMLLMLAPSIHQQPEWPFAVALDLSGPGGPRLVPAHPTSFYRSPTGFTAASIAHGEKLFAASCAICHGIADRQAATAARRSDGDLFWLLRNGDDRPGGMPGFGDKLGDGDLWAVIDFLKARDIMRRGLAALPAAPDLPVVVNGKTMPLSRLHGQVIRLVAIENGARLAPLPGVMNLSIDPATDGWTAYATVVGVDAPALRHFSFQIDAQSRLRAIFPPAADGMPDDKAFAAALTSAPK
ncbi:MAG TPA: CopD family protein [Candidatus Cybelea sp.]|nr:CopD family protein [Candidatus Cybelea sp.]